VPKRAVVGLGLVLILIAARVEAQAAPCDADAAARSDAIRAHLDREVHRGRVWDVAWGTGFGVTAVGYGAMAMTRWEFGIELDDRRQAGLWVAAGKSTIAAVSHLVLPLKVEQPAAATGEPCADLEEAERALRVTAKHESQAFWLSVAGGVALNGGALLLLGLRYDAWTEGVISTAIGIPVAGVHAWTAPHASRRGVDEGRFDGPAATWHLDAMTSPRFTGLVLSGDF
jgi:hypothetical protein